MSINRGIRRVVRSPEMPLYYGSFSEVSHTHNWADGQKIYIKNGANYDEYVFSRTDLNTSSGGQWLATGITTGAAADW